MLTNQGLHSDESSIEQVKEYRMIICSLHYLTLTRPDIQFVVNKLSQYILAPKPLHWKAVEKVPRYLSCTQMWGITLRKVSEFTIMRYCDVDWVGDKDDRKSQTGYLLYVGDSLVAWSSHKQDTMSHSSTKSECRAIATIVYDCRINGDFSHSRDITKG